MGQKTHPLGFRLGITQEHRSAWYADFKHYSTLLEEDDKIRTYLNKLAKFASISNIHINRNGLGDQIELNIETGRPGILVGDNGSEIKTLAAILKSLYRIIVKLLLILLKLKKLIQMLLLLLIL